ncbi:MAG: DUF192 domain-containing protein [Bryobacteraceae bacterium]
MATTYAVINTASGIPISGFVWLAGTSSERRKGLRGVERLADGHGLWISPCEAIHTFGMKIAIDAVFIGRDHRVKKVYSALRPGRIAWCLTAESVLELPENSVAQSQTKAGDQLAISRTVATEQ